MFAQASRRCHRTAPHRMRWMPASLAIGSVCVLAHLTLGSSAARAARWTYFTVGSGLPGNSVQALAEAPDAAVWAATATGLGRYDGTWRSITSERFDALGVDTNGVVWAGGQLGRLQWYSASGAVLPAPTLPTDPSPADDIFAMQGGGAGEMWLAARAGLWHWHRPGALWEFSLFATGRTWTVDVGPSGTVWFGADDGLGRIVAGTPVVIPPPNAGSNPAEVQVTAVLALADGSALLGTASGHVWWTPDGQVFQSVGLGVGAPGAGARVDALLEDSRGRAWVARTAAHQLDRTRNPSDPATWGVKSIGNEEGLAGNRLVALLETRAPGTTRSMWFGGDAAISVLSSFSWAAFTTVNGLAGAECAGAYDGCNDVTAIVPDPTRDAVWFGAASGLSRLSDGSQWTGWLGALWGGPLQHPRVRSLSIDPDGTVWVATGQPDGTFPGVQYHLPGDDDATWRTLGQGNPRWRVAALGRDEAGYLWLAAGDGAWRYDTSAAPFTTTQFTAAEGLPAPPLTAVAAGAGRVVVGAQGAVAIQNVATQQWAQLRLQDALPGGDAIEVRGLLVVSDRLLVCTSAGLLVGDVAAGSLATSTLLDGAAGFADDVRAAVDGGDGFYLVATANGLYRLDHDLSRWRRLGVGDGLPSDALLCVAADGDELWIGSAGDGAATHRFEFPDTRITLAPPPVVTSRAVSVLAQVEALDPDSDPGQISFQWRVDGGDWSSPSPERTVSFVPAELALADGAHTIALRAVDPEFNSDPTPATALFELDTTPPAPRIDAPGAGAVLQGVVAVRGAATDARFAAYAVTVWPKGTPAEQADTLQSWTSTPVPLGDLASWNTAELTRFPDQVWVLRVSIADQLGVTGYTQIEVLVDNQAPFSAVSSPVLARGDLGATVWTVGGEAQLLVPPFAFAGERVISLDAEASTESPAGFAARVGPADVTFGKTATLRLRASAHAEQQGPLAVFQNTGGGWSRLGGTRQVEAQGDPATAGRTFYSVPVTGAALYALLPDPGAPGGGTVISALATEPRFFAPASGAGDGRMAISFALARPSAVKAVVYNRAGRLRRELADGLQLPAGQNVLFWDGHDQDGETVAAGLYIVCVEADDERVTQVVSVGKR